MQVLGLICFFDAVIGFYEDCFRLQVCDDVLDFVAFGYLIQALDGFMVQGAAEGA